MTREQMIDEAVRRTTPNWWREMVGQSTDVTAGAMMQVHPVTLCAVRDEFRRLIAEPR